MTTIQIQVNDDSIVQKIMTYLKRFKIPIKIIENDDDELLAAIHQMDNKIYHEVTMNELHQLIHN